MSEHKQHGGIIESGTVVFSRETGPELVFPGTLGDIGSTDVQPFSAVNDTLKVFIAEEVHKALADDAVIDVLAKRLAQSIRLKTGIRQS